MVYCGKPSKACAECRLRRTKCDYKRPSCSQCVRAGRTCKGYRDPTDLMFRDESQGLNARRERLKDSKSQKVHSKESVITFMNTTEPVTLPNIEPSLDLVQFPNVPVFLAPSIEEQATCFFFQNYVLGKDSLDKGNFQYLADIYGSEEIGPAMTDGIAALGLVGLSHFWHASNIMSTATIKYNSAMKTVSKKLRNIDEAKSDQTMISIMLLALYETNICHERKNMETWTQHITGAISLLQLRGIEQLRTPIGYNLFVHLRTTVIINCIQRHVPVPSIFTTWSQTLDFETIEQAAASQLSIMAIKYCDLRASMSSFHDYSNPERIISAACALDAEYDFWAKTCPLQYIYQTIPLNERSDEVFSDHYHIYSTVWIATIWNHYRSNRILINELILDQLNWLYNNDPSSILLWDDSCFFENQIMESNKTLLQLCHDICSSVPYFLGFDPSIKNPSERPTPKAVNGNLLLWPLYAAGVTGMVSDIMRNWVAGRLEWISEAIGIRQAESLAFMTRKRKELMTWKRGHEIEDIDTTSSEAETSSCESSPDLVDSSLTLFNEPLFLNPLDTINPLSSIDNLESIDPSLLENIPTQMESFICST